MTLARLKPELTAPGLDDLAALVQAVSARMAAPGVSMGWDRAQADWPELVALADSVERDEGWQLFACYHGTNWAQYVLYLDAPSLFLRSTKRAVTIWPEQAWWSNAALDIFEKAKRARAKRLGKAVPEYTDAVLTALRDRRWAAWGRA